MEFVRQSYPMELFSATRRFEGIYEPTGALFDDVNNPSKGDFALSKATCTVLSPDSLLSPVSLPEVVVRKHDVIFFYFKDESAHDKFRLLARTEKIVVYTATFALRGDFHLGVEQRVRDMFDTMRGDFQPMTDVTIFPLIKTQVPIPRQLKMAFINIKNIQLYHPLAQE